MSDEAVVGLLLAVAIFGALAADAIFEWANGPRNRGDE